MQRLILHTIGIIVTSLYFFPITFSFFPVSNTKNLMAAVGLLIATIELLKTRKPNINKDFLVITMYACIVSLAGLISVAYNETPDYTYATYITTFFLWILAAYVVIFTIRKINGQISIELLCNYFIVLCVLQCISVLLIDSIPSIKNWTISYIVELGSVEKIKRLYGFGPHLDVAGTRFSAVLMMIIYMIEKNKNTENTKLLTAYVTAFFIIVVIGSMVSRTTTVGAGIAFVYLLWGLRKEISHVMGNRVFTIFIIIIIIGIFVSTYYYNTSPAFRENIRFAFEGFFNWWETGEWETVSTNRWQTMFIWPDTPKTWFIGDGYFEGASDTDPYYTGTHNSGFYKWTDIGYLRFIFYFGVIGLVLFIGYFCKVAEVCATRFTKDKSLFVFLLLLNFVIWFKVSTDVFLVFAPFLLISREENEEYEKSDKVELFS